MPRIAADNLKPLIDALDDSDWTWMFKNWIDVDQVFTHFELATGKMLHVNVQTLAQAIHDRAIPSLATHIEITEELFNDILSSQGIEQSYIDEMSLDDAVYKPCIIVELPNATHIIADGNHRIVRCYMAGLRRHPAYIVGRADIEPFVMNPPPRIAAILRMTTETNVQLVEAFARARRAIREEKAAAS